MGQKHQNPVTRMCTIVTCAFLLHCMATVPALKIGFIGDSGAQTSSSSTGFHAKAVYDLMSAQGVDFVVQNGDLDYLESPLTWENFLVARNLEVLVTSGNHEEQSIYNYQWYGASGYKARMENLQQTSFSQFLDGSCSGEYGERYQCTIGNSFFALLGWAQAEPVEVERSNRYLEEALKNSNSAFKFCVWHRPEGKMNPGDVHTSNYGSQMLYETCRRYGAIITSGHSHVYGRTKLINDFTGDPVVSPNDAFHTTVSCGETVSFVVGMAGFKYDDDGPYATANWFRTRYTRTTTPANALRAGALICNTGDSLSATSMSCEFRLSDTTSTLIEAFNLSTTAGGTACVLPTMSPTTYPTAEIGKLQYSSTEDAEQASFGYMYKTSSDLELLHDATNGGEQVVGMRFTGIEVPRNAKVLSSHIEFEADESDSGSVSLQIEGHLAPSSPLLGFDFFYLNSLPRTSNPVPWTITESWTDTTTILQEIVDQSTWEQGNDITLIISRPPTASPTTNKRVATSHAPGPGPVLHIQYQDDVLGPTEGNETYECFDDVEEQSNGVQFGSSFQLDLPMDTTNQLIGLRFLDLDIAQGVTIDSAFLTFQCHAAGSGNPSMVISGQKSANASALARSSFYLSGLLHTNANVSWTNEPSWIVGQDYTTPELKTIIQEIIDQPLWSPMNALVLLINATAGSTGSRVAGSVEGPSAVATSSPTTGTPTATGAPTTTGSPSIGPSNPPGGLSLEEIISIAAGASVAALALLGVALLACRGPSRKNVNILDSAKLETGDGEGAVVMAEKVNM